MASSQDTIRPGIYRDSLKRKIIFQFIGTALVVSAIVVSITLYIVQRTTGREIDRQVDQYTESVSTVLELPLWDLDDDAIERIAESLFSNVLVSSFRVEDSFGEVLYDEQKTDVEGFLRVERVEVEYNGLVVGSAEFAISNQYEHQLLQQVYIFSLVFFFSTLLGLLLAGQILVTQIANRIKLLQQAVTDIAAGNFSRRVANVAKDELGALGDAVNKMADTIEQSKANLEHRVAEKTKELSAVLEQVKEQNVRLQDTKRATLNVMEDMETDRQKLEEVTERFEIATGGAGIGVWDWDVSNNILQWDDQMFRLYGVTKESFSGAYDAWQQGLHPDDKSEAEAAVQAALEGKKEFDTTFRIVWPDKSIHHLRGLAVVRRDAEGKATRLIGVNWDMTAEVEATQALAAEKLKDEAIFASIGDGVIVTDKDGTVLLVNDAAVELLVTTKKKAMGQVVADLVHIQDEHGAPIPVQRQPSARALSSGQRVVATVTDKLYYQKRDGTSFPVALTVSPFIENNRIVGAVIVFRDISVERDIDRTKTEFVSLASHQLRTPLSTISWYVEMLLSGDVGTLNKDQQEYLQQVYDSNRRMTELVNALLNVSRLELGTFAVEVEVTNIIEMAQSVVDELTPRIAEKKLSFAADFADDVPAIKVDPRLMRMVFQNLLTNAVKYTPEGGTVSISVALHNVHQNGKGSKKDDSIIIVVQDSGYGIPKSQQSKIFTKLFRADNVKEKDTEGTGLGLYIIKSIVDHSQGRIWFESEEDKGTTFYVTLPVIGMKEKKGTRALQ